MAEFPPLEASEFEQLDCSEFLTAGGGVRWNPLSPEFKEDPESNCAKQLTPLTNLEASEKLQAAIGMGEGNPQLYEYMMQCRTMNYISPNKMNSETGPKNVAEALKDVWQREASEEIMIPTQPTKEEGFDRKGYSIAVVKRDTKEYTRKVVEHELTEFEIAQLINIAPESLEEITALMPSLRRIDTWTIWHYVDKLKSFYIDPTEEEEVPRKKRKIHHDLTFINPSEVLPRKNKLTAHSMGSAAPSANQTIFSAHSPAFSVGGSPGTPGGYTGTSHAGSPGGYTTPGGYSTR